MNYLEFDDDHRIGSHHPILEIDLFVRHVVRTVKPGFIIDHRNGGIDIRPTTLGSKFGKLNYYLSQFDPKLVYGEYAQLFRDTCASLGITCNVLSDDPCEYYPAYGSTGAAAWNSLLEQMRLVSRTPEFKKRVYDREYNSVRNYQSCARYIDALFDNKCSRLLVLRLDFGYGQQHCATIEEALADIEHFLANRRSNSLFDSRVGYCIKFECTMQKGPHFHCFFFLDGSLSCQDVYLAQAYGKYWVKLTEGRGIFHSCNEEKRGYDARGILGIGMIHYADTRMRENLLRPIKYIMKPEQAIIVKASPKARTFWKGEMPAQRASHAGRPRRHTELTLGAVNGA